MNPTVFLLILASVAISALGQVCLKHGMNSEAIQVAMSGAGPLKIAVAIGTNLFVVIGMGLYVLGAVLWLGVLARVDVSLAYPFVSLGFLFTMIFSVFFLGEHLSLSRMAGTGIIVLGVLVLVRA